MNKVIIGFSGKAGSGKSYIAKHVSSETGIKLVKLDYLVAQVVNKPILRRRLQKKIKIKIPKAHEDIQLFPLWQNLDKDFSKFEHWYIRRLLNRKVKKLIRKSKESLIIDFLSLPMLKVIKKFDEVYLIESDDDVRLEKIMARDDMKVEASLNVEKYLKPYYAFNDAFTFSDIIVNNYETMPKKIEVIISTLSGQILG